MCVLSNVLSTSVHICMYVLCFLYSTVFVNDWMCVCVCVLCVCVHVRCVCVCAW